MSISKTNQNVKKATWPQLLLPALVVVLVFSVSFAYFFTAIVGRSFDPELPTMTQIQLLISDHEDELVEIAESAVAVESKHEISDVTITSVKSDDFGNLYFTTGSSLWTLEGFCRVENEVRTSIEDVFGSDVKHLERLERNWYYFVLDNG